MRRIPLLAFSLVAPTSMAACGTVTATGRARVPVVLVKIPQLPSTSAWSDLSVVSKSFVAAIVNGQFVLTENGGRNVKGGISSLGNDTTC